MNIIDKWQLENSYIDLPKKFYTPINPSPVSAPKLIVLNKKLAKLIGIGLPNDKELRLSLHFLP